MNRARAVRRYVEWHRYMASLWHRGIKTPRGYTKAFLKAHRAAHHMRTLCFWCLHNQPCAWGRRAN